jgi:hypothetical protein
VSIATPAPSAVSSSRRSRRLLENSSSSTYSWDTITVMAMAMNV